MTFSPDVHVMVSPSRAYAEAVRAPARGAWAAVRRPALVALAIATSTAFSSTAHLTLALLVSGLACWSFVPLVQTATAVAVIWRAESTPLPLARRLDLWFMGHLPSSLWIVIAGFIIGNAPAHALPERPLLLSALIAIVWTNVISAAFCRVVLGDSRRAAIARVSVHQVVTWGIALLYFSWAVALWERAAAFIGK